MFLYLLFIFRKITRLRYLVQERQDIELVQVSNRLSRLVPLKHLVKLLAQSLITYLVSEGNPHPRITHSFKYLRHHLKLESISKPYSSQNAQRVVKICLKWLQWRSDNPLLEVSQAPLRQIFNLILTDIVEHGVDSEVSSVGILLWCPNLDGRNPGVLTVGLTPQVHQVYELAFYLDGGCL